jgi:ubiquinone/menaquinone biosynthesis C-methylase UbiE
MSNWNALAELDPLWTVLSDPAKKFGKWDPEEFFSTGVQEAERVLAMCKGHGLNVSYGRFLDFGCGVGRMTRAFSNFFSSCTGIDVSDKMVGLAKKYNADRPQCEFIASSAEKLPFPDKNFDFVFTVLVLQHLPSKAMILNYISEFIRVVKDGGVVVFQVPNEVPWRRRIQGRRRLWSLLAGLGVSQDWLYKKAQLAPIVMNGISSKKIEAFVGSQGAQVKALERYDPTEGEHHSYYYFLVKESPRPE